MYSACTYKFQLYIFCRGRSMYRFFFGIFNRPIHAKLMFLLSPVPCPFIRNRELDDCCPFTLGSNASYLHVPTWLLWCHEQESRAQGLQRVHKIFGSPVILQKFDYFQQMLDTADDISCPWTRDSWDMVIALARGSIFFVAILGFGPARNLQFRDRWLWCQNQIQKQRSVANL